ncbi:indolethylamine N-methyltransferase-like [Pyxicephalus adspersus]|uniref:indolethylamine N-methyltransferase-like n=1 Tax=Pyxicephalus adspersus TaxID=30357 RepID=UPI003B5C0698
MTMDSPTHTFYHIHGIDSRDHLDLYLSNKEDMIFGDDSLKFPIMNFYYQFSSGKIKGNFLIDISFGGFIHHLYSASNYFKDMAILKFTDKCIMEITRWQHDRTGAYDWKHASTAAAEFEGMREQQEIEMCLKSSVKQVLKCDIDQENITAPVVLPLADCVVVACILEAISKTKDEYVRNLEKFLKLLKPGGHLLLWGILDISYMVVGKKRVHFFKYDETFVKDVLLKLGLVIDYYAVQRRRNKSDLIDYGGVIFISAHRE